MGTEERKQKKRRFREAMHRFKTEVVLAQGPGGKHAVGITGLFEDKKDGDDRAIILYSSKTKVNEIEPLVARAFKGFQWKLVKQRKAAQGTALSGADVFHDQRAGQGTLGGWLVDPGSGERYGFSNNHVIASLGTAPVGSGILQATRRIGGLRAYIQLDQRVWNTADLAIFTVDPGIPVQWAHPVPLGNSGAFVGLRVYKHGSASRYTEGTVSNSNGALMVELNGYGYWFNGVVAIQGDAGSFSESCDSGALVMTRQGNQATAILFAKDRYSGHSYAFPIGAAYPLFRNLHYAT